MRIIYRFGKLGRLRYISHLDLQRFMMRALRRTDLPVSYSQGFNPHPQMSFASALAMGWASTAELMDIKLTGSVEIDHALEQMRSALPPEMPVYSCRLVEDRHPALMANLIMADYRVELKGTDAEKIIGAVDGYLAEETVMGVRKTKSGEKEVNIRPQTIALSAQDNVLYARLMLTPEDTLKPDTLVGALAARSGAVDYEGSICRTALLTRREGGEIVDLMEL